MMQYILGLVPKMIYVDYKAIYFNSPFQEYIFEGPILRHFERVKD